MHILLIDFSERSWVCNEAIDDHCDEVSTVTHVSEIAEGIEAIVSGQIDLLIFDGDLQSGFIYNEKVTQGVLDEVIEECPCTSEETNEAYQEKLQDLDGHFQDLFCAAEETGIRAIALCEGPEGIGYSSKFTIDTLDLKDPKINEKIETILKAEAARLTLRK